jgi:hypothetical protein
MSGSASATVDEEKTTIKAKNNREIINRVFIIIIKILKIFACPAESGVDPV